MTAKRKAAVNVNVNLNVNLNICKTLVTNMTYACTDITSWQNAIDPLLPSAGLVVVWGEVGGGGGEHKNDHKWLFSYIIRTYFCFGPLLHCLS